MIINQIINLFIIFSLLKNLNVIYYKYSYPNTELKFKLKNNKINPFITY